MCRTGPIIPMREVARAYLISYDRERDLNPLIVANCTYSLEAGKGSEISYNYASLERQLIDRFLSGKRRLEFEVQAKTKKVVVLSQHCFLVSLTHLCTARMLIVLKCLIKSSEKYLRYCYKITKYLGLSLRNLGTSLFFRVETDY